MIQTRASTHQAYVEALHNYCRIVPSPYAARTFAAGVAYGMLAGTCLTLGFSPKSDAVRVDITALRQALYAPIGGPMGVNTDRGYNAWQERLQRGQL